MAVQVSIRPDGSVHVADFKGDLRSAAESTADHFTHHAARGGFASIVPMEPGVVAVQLFAPDGTVEAFRLIVR